MQFLNLTLENFKSFIGQHSFNFRNGQPGLHFIEGDNQVEDIGGNGAGKSTLFDAIYWCLYGKTLRGLRAGNVRTWESEDFCQVMLDFELYGNTYRLIRSWNPKTLTLFTNKSEETIEDQDVIDLINLEQEEFQNSIIIGQFTHMFFDLQPAAKLSMFSSLLNLDFWLDKSREAQAECIALRTVLSGHDRAVSELQGRLDELREQIKLWKEASTEFKSEKTIKIKEIKDGLISIVTNKTRLNNSIEEETKKLSGGKKALESLTKKRDNVINEYQDNLDPIINGLEQAKAELNGELEQVQKSYRKFESVKGVCPYCQQKVSKNHTQSHLDELGSTIEDIKNKISVIRINLRKQNSSRNELYGQGVALDRDIDQKRDDNDSIIPIINNLAHKLTIETEQIKTYNGLLKRYQTQENPFISYIKSAIVKRDDFKDQISKRRKDCKKLEQQHTATDYWIKGFKDIRLFIVENALLQLAIEVNNALTELGLVGWEISFDVERETKSGSISKGFIILIKSPYNSDMVPWEVWSGGETQRLRLAGTIGLANLILNRKGIKPSFECWDEPTTGYAGIDSLLLLLQQRSRELNKQVWLIDHRSLDFGFDSVTTIIKDEKGSHIVG